MIKRMLISDVVQHLKGRQKFIQEAKKARKKHGKDSAEYKKKVKELKTQAPHPLYLEEDCSLLTSSGFKKGREIFYDEAIRLLDYGFYLVWLSDKPISEDEKKADFVYTLKSEIENLLGRVMVTLDETEGKKPGSNIKYIEKNDLLKQTIEALQVDGTKYLARSIFGESGKRIQSLKTFVRMYFKKGPEQVGIFDNICLGNAYKSKKKAKDKDKAKDKANHDEKSNYILRFMINIGLAFMATIRNIQNERLERDPKDIPEINRRPDTNYRHGYDEEQLVEGSLAAFFCEYGYLHFAIDNLIQRSTNPFYNDKGELEGEGIVPLGDKNKLIHDKHSNVSYHLFASMKDQGFVGDIARDVLQYHHRGLNDTGYPKRKLTDEKVSEKDREGNVFIHSQKCYEIKVLEMTRLVGIINFFMEYTSQTALHIPFQRDNVVRHILINSVYPQNSKSKPDLEGIFDIQTQYPQNKKFDGFLADRFLKSVNIYKEGEDVPVYNFNNTKNKLYDAVVIKQNEYAHRPVLSINEDGEEKELDLSKAENDSLYIGEYFPSLRFLDVIEEYHLDKVDGGISLDDQAEDDENLQGSKRDQETDDMLDNIFDDTPQVIESDSMSEGDSISMDDLLAELPPGLAEQQKKQKEIKKEDDAIKIEKEAQDEQNQEAEGEDISVDASEDILNEIDLDSIDESVPEEAIEEVVEEDKEVDIPNDLDEIPIIEEEKVEEDSSPAPEPEETFAAPAINLDDIETGSTIEADQLLAVFSDDPLDLENEVAVEEEKTEPVEAAKTEEIITDEVIPDELPDFELPEEEPESGIATGLEDELSIEDLDTAFADDSFDEAEEIETAEVSIPDTALSGDAIDGLFDDEAPTESAEIESPVAKEKPVTQENLANKLYSIYIKRENEFLPFGLGKLVASSSDEKRFRIRYLSQCVKETTNHFLYHYSLVNSQDQQVISTFNPKKYSELGEENLNFFVKGKYTSNTFEEKIEKPVFIGSYHFLYYVEEQDSKKRLGGQGSKSDKGIPKYVVRIKEKGSTPSKPVVTFIRYIQIKGSDIDYMKDKNCGKDFDLSQVPFFRLDRELTAKELVNYLNLVLV